MLVGKWTVEGVLKSSESIAQRIACVKGEGGVGILQRARSIPRIKVVPQVENSSLSLF